MTELRGVVEVLVGLLLAAYGWILRDAHARLQRLEREAVRDDDHQADRAQIEKALGEIKRAVNQGFEAQRQADKQLSDEMVRLHERQTDRISRVVGELHAKVDGKVDTLRAEFRASQRPP